MIRAVAPARGPDRSEVSVTEQAVTHDCSGKADPAGFARSFRARPENELRASKQRQRPPFPCVSHHGVPYLRGATEVRRGGDTGKAAFARRPKEVGLQLDSSEVFRAWREVSNATVAAGGVGECNHGGRMKIAVRRKQLRSDLELGVNATFGDGDRTKSD